MALMRRRTSVFKDVSDLKKYQAAIAQIENVFDQLEQIEYTEESIKKFISENTTLGETFRITFLSTRQNGKGFWMNSLDYRNSDTMYVSFTTKHYERYAKVTRLKK